MEPIWPSGFQANVVKEGFGYKLSGYSLALEAWRRGLTVTLLDSNIRNYRISDDAGNIVEFVGSRPASSKNAIVKDKHKTNQLLQKAGVSVPKSIRIDPSTTTSADLTRLASQLGYPVVLKPRDGARGEGVYSNIREDAVLVKRFTELKRVSPSSILVLENHVPGEDYRVLVYGDHYIAACRRVPANVVGDGVSTVEELIIQKNRLRRSNPFLSTGLIQMDHEATDYLLERDYTYQSVPGQHEYIQLRGAANASAGGDVIDVTDQLPQDIRESAVKAVQAIPGLQCAGVDVLVDRALSEHAILELNGLPQIGINMYPTQGAGVNVPMKVMDIHFPESRGPGELGDTKLSLNVEPILAVLSSGHASEVTLAPLPSHRYRHRYVYDLDGPLELSKRRRAQILRLARRNEVAGFLRPNNHSQRMMVAGSESSIETFTEGATYILGVNANNRRRWNGVVSSGFKIRD